MCALEFLCFSLFLAGPEISPLWLPFSFIASFQRLFLSSFVSFSPWNDAFQDCHLDSCALLGLFLIVSTTIYQDFTVFYTSGWHSFQQWFQIHFWLHSLFLLFCCIQSSQGRCPKCDIQLYWDLVLTFFSLTGDLKILEFSIFWLYWGCGFCIVLLTLPANLYCFVGGSLHSWAHLEKSCCFLQNYSHLSDVEKSEREKAGVFFACCEKPLNDWFI